MTYATHSMVFAGGALIAAWFIGLGVLGLLRAPAAPGAPPPSLLAFPLGIGCLAVLLTVLAAAGLLRPGYIVVAVALAVALSIRPRLRMSAAPSPDGGWLGRAAAAALSVTVLLLAFTAPLEWDELSYHLPYAREYAEAGGLVVSERLRFPLHPHNFQILYAAALALAAEPAAHLLHAAAGVWVAAGIYAWAVVDFGRATAWLAVLLWLAASHGLMDSAYVDLGLSLFVFFAFYSLRLWQRTGHVSYALLAGFLLAMGAGTKYHGLAQLPVFLLALLAAGPGREIRPWLYAAVVFLLFGSFWYLRSMVIAGDPVHPLGGPWFGFWLWDAGDLAGQYADVAQRREPVPWELLPAFGALALREARAPGVRLLLAAAFGGLLVWYLTSGYDRYLLSSYPLLALASAWVMVRAGCWLLQRAPVRRLRNAVPNLRPAFVQGVGFALLAAVLVQTVARKADDICFTRACVDTVQTRRLASPGVIRDVPGLRDLRLYQLGLENELFLLGPQAVGDWYGPYRYREVLALQGDPRALARHLRALGRDSLIVNRQREPFSTLGADGSLAPVFETVYEDERAGLYRIADE